MAQFYAFKTIDIGPVNPGTSQEAPWKSDDNYIIHKIYFIEKTGATLYKYVATIRIDGYVLTKDIVPASLLAPDSLHSPVLDVPLGDSRVITISVLNGESAARDCWVVLELWK